MNHHFTIRLHEPNYFPVIIHKAFDLAAVDLFIQENPPAAESWYSVEAIIPVFWVYYKPSTVGCYGTDKAGSQWTTWGGPSQICAECGKRITLGYHNATQETYFCVDHIGFVPEDNGPEPTWVGNQHKLTNEVWRGLSEFSGCIMPTVNPQGEDDTLTLTVSQDGLYVWRAQHSRYDVLQELFYRNLPGVK